MHLSKIFLTNGFYQDRITSQLRLTYGLADLTIRVTLGGTIQFRSIKHYRDSPVKSVIQNPILFNRGML
jgi:hypothetical protein